VSGHPGFWRITLGKGRGIYHFGGQVVRFYMFGDGATVYQQFESRRWIRDSLTELGARLSALLGD